MKYRKLQSSRPSHHYFQRHSYSSVSRKKGQMPRKVLALVLFTNIITIVIMFSIHKSLVAFNGYGIYKNWDGILEERDFSVESVEKKDRIPHRIIIMDRGDNLSDIISPRLENTYNTIRQYHNAWFPSNDNLNSTDSNHLTEEQKKIVSYLNDASCIKVLNQTEPKLIPFFEREIHGKYKADICRVAELFSRGGYYFDTDMKVTKPLLLQPQVTFTAPFEADSTARTDFEKEKMNNVGIFNSFIASAPKHPILRNALNLMLSSYEGKIKLESQLGPATLFKGYQQFERSSTYLKQLWPIDMTLAETYMNKRNYPNFPRNRGTGCCCDFVIHNFTERDIYFYSRIPGASKHSGRQLCKLTE